MDYKDQNGIKSVEIIRNLIKKYTEELNDSGNRTELDERYELSVKNLFYIIKDKEIAYLLTALYLGRECFDSYENKELSNKQSIFEDQYRETLKNNDDNVDYMKQQIISKKFEFTYQYTQTYLDNFSV
ncbi:hypothetical protein [Staphylococcus hominis]|uniref:hypothetical protein n=1 Tax=Staphylococcus hominis TaxID=1290 RepID=UPI0011A3C8A0|nr:hypothetical protein [Staphylococcus hominis]